MRRLFRVVAACASLALCWRGIATAAVEPDGPSSVAANEALARRVFEELFNQRRPEIASEIYAQGRSKSSAAKDGDIVGSRSGA